MNPILRNILAIVVGWFGGSLVNMGLIKVGHLVKPIEGLDPNDMDIVDEQYPLITIFLYRVLVAS